MMWSAFGDLLTFDFIKAAIEGENLGSNPAGVPDILAISWTSHDYVNHLFGPESRQSQDQTVRLDRIFADLFDYLDKRIGLQNVLITLSADHGFMNIPEYSASRNLDAGRIDPDKMIEGTNAALSAKFGDGKYITAWWNPNLYVDYKLIEFRKLNKVEVENAAQDFLRDYPGVEAVYTRTQMEQGMMPNTKLAKQVILAWHQKISGDIVDHEQAELVSVRQAQHLRVHPWIALVVRHQRAVGHVWSELDQAWQVRRFRSGGPRAHHCLPPECAATERLRGPRVVRGAELVTMVEGT